METRNHTAVSEFLLLGLTEDPALQPLVFSLFLSMYLVTILGNLLIILAISSDSHLHTPMYFFLCNLSLNDICLSTSMIPKMLVNIQTQNQSISYAECISQLCFVLVFSLLENFLLAVMAYDRYVAICHPLSYMVIMNPCLCVVLVQVSLIISTGDGLLHSLMVLRLSFCTDLGIPDFFCELAQLIKLACSDTLIHNILEAAPEPPPRDEPSDQDPSVSLSVSARLEDTSSIFKDPDLQPILFVLFLCMYLVTILGNLLIILAISNDSHLHTPMYFFLANLSLTDICLSSSTIPKMLVNILTQNKMMAYDRYVAICHPLRYTVLMNPWLCGLLMLFSLLISLVDGLLHTLMVLRLSFCTDLEIPHFFCELAQIIKLACSDIFVDNILIYVVACLFGGIPFSGIIFSYVHIVSSVLRMPSSEGKHKAFSTCGSHLSVVSLFYGTAFGVYISSAVSDSPRKTAMASVMYTVVPQLMNSFIYGLRNKDMKEALGKLIRPQPVSSQVSAPQLGLLTLLPAGGEGHDPTHRAPLGWIHQQHEPRNQTTVSEFLLLGLTEDPALQPLVFSLFLSMYLVTILGNLLIILAISSDSHLHTPMYFFLSNLSLTDISLSTITVPKMLVNIQRQSKTISYAGCLTQVYFALVFVGMENFLLAAMAFDRYVAICHPLRYTVIMNLSLCVLMILSSLCISTVDALLHTLMVLRLSFCTDLEIPHFFCELAQMIKLACSDTFIDNILIYIAAVIFGGVPLSGIIFSYTHIASSVLRMPSSGGKYKAFSTCGSHLSVVSLFYGTAFGVYISSEVTDSPRKTAVASVMYSVVPQMLNPFIYSLRNRDMKEALRKLISRTSSFLLCFI
ncbi:hypothetical protein GHT09_006691 [Marmota monax]|uniref:G-protein coupled receptors family 1 profile domain-containing protein n=1 Tax=Marmota monax TaxID=9995 RepID=A0A834V4E4_MARMO|nr:hypothetical protein GHT09_006691 [Marmota monax]